MEINVYPNPAHGYLTINLSERGIRAFEIRLISSKGAIVYCDQIWNAADCFNYSLDVTGLSKGNYSLYISTKEETWSRKVLIR